MTLEIQKRLCCLIGLLGGLIFLTGDFLFYAAIIGAHDLHSIDVMITRTDWQLLLAGALGPIGGIFYAIGMSIFFLTLRPVNWRLAAFASFALAAMVLVGGAYHAVFTMYGFVGRVHDASERELLISEVRSLYNWLAWMSYTLGVLGTIAVIALGVQRKSEFPKWLLLFLPTTLVILCLVAAPVFDFIPAPLGGLIKGGRINGSFILFFAVATIAFWRPSRKAA